MQKLEDNGYELGLERLGALLTLLPSVPSLHLLCSQSPFQGKSGKHLTSSAIRTRLEKEMETDADASSRLMLLPESQLSGAVITNSSLKMISSLIRMSLLC